jgi:hypothetical protein
MPVHPTTRYGEIRGNAQRSIGALLNWSLWAMEAPAYRLVTPFGEICQISS